MLLILLRKWGRILQIILMMIKFEGHFWIQSLICKLISGWFYLLRIKVIRVCEQPLKIPHIAAVLQHANDTNGDVIKEVLKLSSERAQDALERGRWREFKLLLRLFACWQGIFEGD